MRRIFAAAIEQVGGATIARRIVVMAMTLAVLGTSLGARGLIAASQSWWPFAPNVSVLCVDDNGGATDAPCANPTAFTTIQAAVNAAVAGDEIRVAAGNYGATTFDKSVTVRGGYAGGPGGWSTASPSNVVALDGNISINSGLTLTMGDFFTLNGLSSVNSGTLDNTGTLTKVGGGAAQFSSVFNNSGTVNVTGGTLFLGSGNSSGLFNVSTGATLEMCNCFGHTFGPASTITGAGTFRVSGSSHVVSGTLSVQNLNMVGGTLNIDSVGANTASTVMTMTHTQGILGGTRIISVTNRLDWSGGQHQDAGRTDVLAGAQLNITGGVGIAGRVFNNYGTGTWSGGGGISIGTGGAQPGTFNNQAGATFTILNDQTVETGGGSSFNNVGTITKQSAGPTFFNRLTNSGSLDVQSGLFLLGGGNSTGQFNVAAGATLNLCNCLTQTFEVGSSISGGGTLLVNGSVHTINGFYSLPNLTVSGGALFVNSVGANTASTVMTLTQTGGTLGGTRAISVTSQLTVSNGSMVDAGRTDLLPGAQANLGQTYLQNGRVFNNYGTTVWTGGSLQMAGTFNNHPGASFSIQSEMGVDGGTFNNLGTITKLGAGSAIFSYNVPLNNGGAVNIQAGVFSVSIGTSSGTFSIANGAILQTSGGNHTFQASSTISGAGRVVFENAIQTIDGTYNVSGPTIINSATANFNSVGANTASTMGVLTQTSGVLGGTRVISITNRLDWTGGSQTDAGRTDILTGAQFNLLGNLQMQGSRTINNYGTATWNGIGNLDLGSGNGQTFNNRAGGTFTILSGSQNIGGGGTFNNFGTFTKQGTGTTIFHFGPTFNNSGTADVQAGTLSIGVGSSSGTFSIAADATLRAANDNHTFQAASSISGAGQVFFTSGVHTVDGAYTISGPTTLDGAVVNFNSVGANTATTMGVLTHTNGSTLGGTRVISITNRLDWGGGVTRDAGRTDILPGAQLNITGQHQVQTVRVINNYGTATLSGAGILNTNPGTFNNHVGATFTTLNNNEIGGGGTFNNMGTFIKQSGTGTTQITCNFSNSGLVEVLSGTLFYIFNNTYSQTAGATRMAGGNLRFENTFQLQGGALEGPGTITGSVNNSGGTVSPGASPGLMTITGNYTQGAGGTLNIELGGLAPVAGYDQLDVDGTATLNGTLNTSAIDGFVPQNGDSFTVLLYGSRTGTFSTIQGGTYTANYNANDLTLVVGGPVSTATPTATQIPTTGPTNTPTSTATDTVVPTSTNTNTPTISQTPTGTPTSTTTGTSTNTPTATQTGTATNTTIATFTNTAIPTSTNTATSIPPSATRTGTSTATALSTATLAPTLTRTSTVLPTSTSTSSPTHTPTRTVTSTAVATATQTATPVSFVVTNTNDSGPGSLRQAILNANSVPGFDTITFNIQGSGVQRIAVASNLPFITDGVNIDGLSQPGANGASTPLIELDGQNTATYGFQMMVGSVVQRLTINRFVTAGILLVSNDNVIRGNFIGTDATGTQARGNGYGVLVKGANNFIGVTSPDENTRNLISGNLLAGVVLLGNGTSGNRIQHSYIGTDLTGTAAIGNGTVGTGVHLGTGAQSNTIGGTTQDSRNVISGHQVGQSTGSGIRVEAQAISNAIRGNYIGTDASGQAALGNSRGIEVIGAGEVTIGGTGVADGNVISGNGIGISLAANVDSNGSIVRGNLIGTNAAGTGAVGNSNDGIRIESSDNRIGGTTAGARNIIAGNGGDGVNIRNASALNTIQGNYIGITAGGSALGNQNGVRQSDGLFNTIGGNQSGSGNVISGNDFSGIVVLDGTATIMGNLIGTDPTGTLPLGNGSSGIGSGIGIGGGDATVGGSAAGTGNVVSSNGRGIYVTGGQAVIKGNKIGTDISGTLDLGNQGPGVYLINDDNIVGGSSPGDGNLIAFNDAGGVVVSGNLVVDGKHNRIEGNRIFNNVNPQSNDDLGIDLGDDGVTANDNCDPDAGANDLQNFPVLTSVITGTNAITITGSLNSVANSSQSLHFYASQFCHPSGFGEGEIYLGSRTSLFVGGSCNVNFSVRLSVTVPDGYFITSTATDFNGDTSEFSACLVVGQPNATPTATRTGTVTPTRTSTGVPPTPTRTNTAVATSTRTVTSTATQTATGVPATATRTGTATFTPTATLAPTFTRTSTAPPSTSTSSPTVTATHTATRTPTTPSNTSTRTQTGTATPTSTVTRTPTRTLTPAATATCAPNWQQVVSPNPPSNTIVQLNDVAVRTATDAWAVGESGNDPWILRWNGGSWSTVSSPNPGVRDTLKGVSSISSNDVWAVGSYECGVPCFPNPREVRTLTMHWDGGAWSVIQSPNPGLGSVDRLNEVSALASNDVWAVGLSYNDSISSASQPLAMHWNGAQWSTTPLQNPGDQSAFNAVHARAANDVWAVGSRASLSGSQQPLFYRWNGSQWNGQIGGQGLRQGTLYDVAALAANDVWAVGVPVDGGGTPRPWVLRFDGQAWREDTNIPQEVDSVQLYGISASSPTNVWVVGRTEGRTLRYHWNGSSWTRYSNPDPSPQDGRQLLGVAALVPNYVWAVGNAQNGSLQAPYIERFSNACPPPPTATPTGTSTPTATPDSYVVIPGTATIVPGTTLISGSQCNDCTVLLNLPFSARLYDQYFSSARLGSNGTLGYTGNVNPPSNNCLPTTSFNNAILPYWDDLDTSSRTACNGPCGIFTSISGAAPNRIFNIEWRAILLGGSRFVNFEVRLYERQNRTDLVYGALDPLSSHTIAVQRDIGSYVTRIYCDSGLGPDGPEFGSSPDHPDDWIVQPGMMLSLVRPAGEPTPTPTICPLQFTDVPPDHTFYPFIRCLACQGILSGYADGTFLPGNDVTRGQLAKIVSNASGFIEPVTGQTFTDVPPDHTFYEYIERIAIRGIISGYSDGTFRPQNNATRGQIAKIVANTASFSETVTGQTFVDVPLDHTFYEYIERMAQRNIIGGYSDGTFRPQNNATRGQTAKIVANTFFPGCQTP